MNNEYKFSFFKALLHLKTILIHKYWVFIYCCKAGIIWRGIKHDISKFSPSEFIPNVKYVKCGISPIDVQRKEIGYAMSWFHHKGHNSHHWVYWTDRFDEGCYATRMPLDDAIECVCDLIGASRAYNGKNYSTKLLIDYWNKNIKNKEIIHPDTRDFIDYFFIKLHYNKNISESYFINHKYMKKVYDNIIKNSKYDIQIKISDIIEMNKK